jgi:nucleoid DNA-binding protein
LKDWAVASRKDTDKGSRPSITRAHLTEQVYRRHGGLTKGEAAEIVNKIFETVKVNLLEGRPVKIQNFGVFEVAARKGRAGVDPTNGAKIFIPPHRSLNFRPAPKLKKAVQKRRDRGAEE